MQRVMNGILVMCEPARRGWSRARRSCQALTGAFVVVVGQIATYFLPITTNKNISHTGSVTGRRTVIIRASSLHLPIHNVIKDLIHIITKFTSLLILVSSSVLYNQLINHFKTNSDALIVNKSASTYTHHMTRFLI